MSQIFVKNSVYHHYMISILAELSSFVFPYFCIMPHFIRNIKNRDERVAKYFSLVDN